VFQQSDADSLVVAVHWLGVTLLLAGALACAVLSPRVLDRLGISMLSAVFGVFLICTLKLPPEDTSAASQAFFAFPVFWAASHLQAAGVALATANR
jgi:hypothetical protein